MPNRFTGIADVFEAGARILGIGDKPWGAGLVAVLSLGAFSPLLLRNQRVGRARRILTRASFSSSTSERNALEQEALVEVKGNPDGLIVVAETALQRGRLELAKTALDQLAATGARPGELRSLRQKLDGDAPKSVDEAIVRIERLLGMGLGSEARERWGKARERWPDDPDLQELEARLP